VTLRISFLQTEYLLSFFFTIPISLLYDNIGTAIIPEEFLLHTLSHFTNVFDKVCAIYCHDLEVNIDRVWIGE
jgi:hypothetical protein